MKTVFNFGHPLSEKAKGQLDELIGENAVVHQPTAVELSKPVGLQVKELCRALVREHGRPDYIILPGLAIAAVYVDRFFSTPEDDYPPCVTYTKLIRLQMEPGTTPPVFVVGGIEE